MAFPVNVDPTVPANTESPSLGASRIRASEQALTDLFGIPTATNITAAILALASTNDGKVSADTVVRAATPYKRLIGTEVAAKDIRLAEDGGVAKLQVNTGTEAVPVWTTVFQFAWSANFAAIFSHTNSAERTYTLPNASVTLAGLGVQDFSGTQRWAKGADLPSAATLVLGTDGNYFHVTGGVTITALSTLQAGALIALEFAAALTLTHNAVSLILPGGANITTAAGDVALVVSEGGGNWRCVSYQRASGVATVVTATDELTGLGLANNGVDLINDIDIAVGAAASDDAAVASRRLMSLTSGLTKQLDAVWAVGTNQGMRASGAVIANTTYHLFLIQRPDTGVVDVAADTSVTGANLAANTDPAYTKKRRIGSILREAGSIVGFVQDGDRFQRKASVLDVSAANPGTAAVTRTLSVPVGLQLIAIVNGFVRDSVSPTATTGYLSDLDVTDEAASLTAAPLGQFGSDAAGGSGPARVEVRTNTSAQVRSRISASNANMTVYVATLGWIDRRGRG